MVKIKYLVRIVMNEQQENFTSKEIKAIQQRRNNKPSSGPIDSNNAEAQAQCDLGDRYWSGKGVEKDFKEAARLFRLAADLGLKQAKLRLAFCYKEGLGVTRDPDEGKRLLCSAYPDFDFSKTSDEFAAIGEAEEMEKQRAREITAIQQIRKNNPSSGPIELNKAEIPCFLGHCYYHGNGVEKDFKEAVYFFRLAAKQGSNVAQFNLGVCFARGEGVEQDYKEAARLFRLAADQGHTQAQFKLAHYYLEGLGIKKDPNEGRLLLRLLFPDHDFSEESNEFEDNENKLTATEKVRQMDEKRLREIKAIQQRRKTSGPIELGDAEAQCDLGRCYWSGKGVEQDFKEAARLFRLAADQGNAEGQCSLAALYERGEGVEQDFKEAARLYDLAANQGHAQAQNNLGFLYINGHSIERDVKKAVGLFRLAADQGFAPGQNSLGYCYFHGQGINKDVKEAIRLFRLAVDQGSGHAKLNLARCYRSEEGVTRDPNEEERLVHSAYPNHDFSPKPDALAAIPEAEREKKQQARYNRLAAAQKHREDQLNLARCYENGDEKEGITKDLDKGKSIVRSVYPNFDFATKDEFEAIPEAEDWQERNEREERRKLSF